MPSSERVLWKIDECAVYFGRLHLRGWCCDPLRPIREVALVFDETGLAVPLRSYGTASADVAQSLGPAASHVRFDEWVEAPEDQLGTPFSLRFRFANGGEETGPDALTNAFIGDPYLQSWENFLILLEKYPSGSVLEIGSRARSAITRRHRIPARLSYVGLDILPGPNVDIVGDAHELASVIRDRKFVAIFSTSVFEHLLMPWKVALEINRVLEPGGIVYTATHQTWPIHEEPWDFWRYSRHAWQAIFNPATGFEIVEAVVGDPARIHACRTTRVTRTTPDSPAYLGSASIVRKISDTTLTWPVPLATATASMYPAGELARPPTPDQP